MTEMASSDNCCEAMYVTRVITCCLERTESRYASKCSSARGLSSMLSVGGLNLLTLAAQGNLRSSCGRMGTYVTKRRCLSKACHVDHSQSSYRSTCVSGTEANAIADFAL